MGAGKERWKQREQGGEGPLSISGRGRREARAGDGDGLRSYSLFPLLLIQKGWTKHRGNNLTTIKLSHPGSVPVDKEQGACNPEPFNFLFPSLLGYNFLSAPSFWSLLPSSFCCLGESSPPSGLVTHAQLAEPDSLFSSTCSFHSLRKVGVWLLGFGLWFFSTSLYEHFPGDQGRGGEKRDLRGFIVWVIFPIAKCQHPTLDA